LLILHSLSHPVKLRRKYHKEEAGEQALCQHTVSGLDPFIFLVNSSNSLPNVINNIVKAGLFI
jgi:hypothetical protein